MSGDERVLVLYDGETEIGRVTEDQARQLLSFVEQDMVQREGVIEFARELHAWLLAGEMEAWND